jgi:hypothetical protein
MAARVYLVTELACLKAGKVACEVPVALTELVSL